MNKPHCFLEKHNQPGDNRTGELERGWPRGPDYSLMHRQHNPGLGPTASSLELWLLGCLEVKAPSPTVCATG